MLVVSNAAIHNVSQETKLMSIGKIADMLFHQIEAVS